jgi:hypothetical protein
MEAGLQVATGVTTSYRMYYRFHAVTIYWESSHAIGFSLHLSQRTSH